MSTPPIRVSSWPPWYAPNRYIECFHRALAPHGIVHVPDLPLDAAELARQSVHVAHVHWAEWAWQSRGRWGFRRMAGVRALERFLCGLEEREIPLVWTVHNLAAHEPGGAAERAGFALLHRRARLRIFHSEHARSHALEHTAGAGDTVVMAHGNYDGVLPAGRDRADVRRALGLGEAERLLLMAGNLRSYKGIERALAALDAIPDAGRYRLWIAGRAQPAQRRLVERLARRHAGARTEFGRLDDSRLADLLVAADAVLLPYSEVTSSGALLMALTRSRGVIVSNLPYFREVLGPEPAAGEIAADDTPVGLAAAISRFFEIDPVSRRAAARRLADRYAWERVVTPVAEWLHANVRLSAATGVGRSDVRGAGC